MWKAACSELTKRLKLLITVLLMVDFERYGKLTDRVEIIILCKMKEMEFCIHTAVLQNHAMFVLAKTGLSNDTNAQ